MKMKALIAALALPCILLVGCAGTEKVGSSGEMDPSAEWWNNPGAVRDRLAAVGTSLHMGNLSQARNSAEADARAKLAATLNTKIQQLVENWAKSAGDMKIKQSISSYVNNESFTRQFVDTYVSGARPDRYMTVGENVHCLMVLEPDKAKAWVESCANAIGDQALRDETLFKTEAMKNQARQRLDNLVKQEKEKLQKSIETVTGSGS